MKPLLVSQRVQVISEYDERRDALDQAWSALLFQAGFLPLLLPNHQALLPEYFNLKPAGLLLTGGNNLMSCEGDAPERDALEKKALEWAIDSQLPVLGVCRGMQLILEHFGGKQQPVKDQVQKTQDIEFKGKNITVNSYHNWGTFDCPESFEVWGTLPENGMIKAIKHKVHALYGIMWHPERILPNRLEDLAFLKGVFK